MPKLELDEASHTYTLDGRRIIGTSETLSILDRRKVDPFYLQRGKFIHDATVLYDCDELEAVDSQIEGYVNAYVKFRKETGFEPDLIEYSLYHPSLFFAGTIDRTGHLNGILDLIDLKSGEPAPLIDPLQGAAYWALCKSNNIPIKKVFDLYLHGDGTYKLEPIEKPKLLLPIFLACVQITRWKEKNK